MKNNASLVYNFFLVIGDFLALVLAFVGAYVLRVTFDARPLIEAIPARTYLIVFLTLLPFWLIIFGLLGLYNSNIYEKRFSELGRLLIGSFIGLLFVIGYDFFSAKPVFPARLVPVYGFILAFLLLVLFRAIARVVRILLFRFNLGITNILIVGDTHVTEELIESLIDSRHSGYRIVGVVGNKQHLKFYQGHVKIYSEFNEATKHIGKQNIYSIVQTELYANPEQNNEILTFAQTNHISYRFVPGNSELFVGNIDVELFRSSIPVITVHQTPLIGWGRIAKRLFDLIVAVLVLIILSPILLLISLFIFLLDPGPVLFRQKRITRFNTPFRIYKFRTMKQQYSGMSPEQAFAKMGKPEIAKTYRENGDQLPRDPRVTLIGRFLRRTSLDELPQLINVVNGELSLVGPRALVPEEIDQADAKHHILSVKCGLTGLAQISGRKDIPYEERRKLDLYYIQNWTFWLDLTILIKTVRVLITRL